MKPAAGAGLGVVGIVIPAFNAGRFIVETLESVRRQSYADFECVVVDDGSTDDTADTVAKTISSDTRFKLLRKANGGVARARNFGASSLSETEYLLFLDADDLLHQDALNTLVHRLSAAPNAVGAHGRMEGIDADGAPLPPGSNGLPRYGFDRHQISSCSRGLRIRVEEVPADAPTDHRALHIRNPIVTPGQVLLRTRSFDLCKGFDPRMPPAEDWDLWLRLAELGSFEYVDKAVLSYRSHEQGASRNSRKMRRAELRVRAQIIRHNAFDPVDSRRAQRYFEWKRCRSKTRLALGRLRHRDWPNAGRTFVAAGFSLWHVARSFPVLAEIPPGNH